MKEKILKIEYDSHGEMIEIHMNKDGAKLLLKEIQNLLDGEKK